MDSFSNVVESCMKKYLPRHELAKRHLSDWSRCECWCTGKRHDSFHAKKKLNEKHLHCFDRRVVNLRLQTQCCRTRNPIARRAHIWNDCARVARKISTLTRLFHWILNTKFGEGVSSENVWIRSFADPPWACLLFKTSICFGTLTPSSPKIVTHPRHACRMSTCSVRGTRLWVFFVL